MMIRHVSEGTAYLSATGMILFLLMMIRRIQHCVNVSAA